MYTIWNELNINWVNTVTRFDSNACKFNIKSKLEILDNRN